MIASYSRPHAKQHAKLHAKPMQSNMQSRCKATCKADAKQHVKPILEMTNTQHSFTHHTIKYNRDTVTLRVMDHSTTHWEHRGCEASHTWSVSSSSQFGAKDHWSIRIGLHMEWGGGSCQP